MARSCKMLMRMGRFLLPLVCFAAFLLAANVALACPTCKDQLAGDPGAANLARGYGMSIIFMLSMPYLILAGLGFYFYWEIRKARARQATVAGNAAEPDSGLLNHG